MQPDVERFAGPAHTLGAQGGERPEFRAARPPRWRWRRRALRDEHASVEVVTGVAVPRDVGSDRHRTAGHRFVQYRDMPSVSRYDPLHQHVGRLHPTVHVFPLAKQAHVARRPAACARASISSGGVPGGCGAPDESGSGGGEPALRGGGCPGTALHDLPRMPFARVTCDRRIRARTGSFSGRPSSRRRAARSLSGTEPPRVRRPARLIGQRAVTRADSGEPRPSRVGVADEAVGEPLEQRVEPVGSGEPDEPRRAESGVPSWRGRQLSASRGASGARMSMARPAAAPGCAGDDAHTRPACAA